MKQDEEEEKGMSAMGGKKRWRKIGLGGVLWVWNEGRMGKMGIGGWDLGLGFFFLFFFFFFFKYLINF